MVRSCLLIVCLCTGLGRTQELATTDDGRELLLSSFWRLPGESFEPLHFAIYRSNGNRWAQVAHTDQGPYLTRPYLSGDGTVQGWDRGNPCSASCMILIPRSATEFVGLTPPALTGTYSLILSRNTRFLLSPGFYGFTDFILQDLSTGLSWRPPAAPYLRAYGVANNGTLIGLAATRDGSITQPDIPNRLIVWRSGDRANEIFRSDSIRHAWISADGARALVDTSGIDVHQPRELWWVDIAGGEHQRIGLLAPDGSDDFLAAASQQISNDGSRVLYFWPSQNRTLWLWQRGSEAQPLAVAEEGFRSAVLSGDGRVAWAFTAGGRLLRIATDTGSASEVLSALPPRLWPGYAGSLPGSAMLWRSPEGGGISAALSFTSGSLNFPVVDDSSRDEVSIQIPWEAAAGKNEPLLVRREGNPFELPLELSIDSEVRPVIAGSEPPGLNVFQVKAALQDFSALVSPGHPVPAGSTMHTWFYNLGPLDRPVSTGAPGPNDPAAVPLAPLGCFLLPAPATPGRGLEIPFLAYAPGLIGVYQADITIPLDWPAGWALLICDSKGAGTAGWVPVGPADR